MTRRTGRSPSWTRCRPWVCTARRGQAWEKGMAFRTRMTSSPGPWVRIMTLSGDMWPPPGGLIDVARSYRAGKLTFHSQDSNDIITMTGFPRLCWPGSWRV